MKKLLLTLFVLTQVCHASFAALVSTSNPSPTLRGINRDIYISMRTDGRRGTGTFEDPFDGSTAAKFDAAFVAAVTSSARIHLGPGTFTTSGNGFATFRFGLTGGSWTVQGAGVGVTTVKLANNIVTTLNGTATVFGQHADDVPSGQTPEYVEICHMTIDANRANQSAVTGGLNCTVGCLGIGARRTHFHDLHAKNGYGKGTESFIVAAAAPAVPDASTVIEKVYVSDLSGWATAINAGGTKSTNLMRGTIQNCRVIGDNTTSAGLGQNGFGGWYLDGFTFTGNTARGVVGGVIVDSFTNNSVTISGNKVYGPYGYGVIFNGAGANQNDITIRDNYFAPYSGSTGVLLDSTLPNNLLILGNQNDASAAGTTNQVTKTELNYLKGLTNNVQGQLNAIAASGGGGGSVGPITGNPATLTFTNSVGGTDSKVSRLAASTGGFNFDFVSDSGVSSYTWLSLSRTGYRATSLDLQTTNLMRFLTPTVQMTGNLDVTGRITSAAPQVKAQAVFDVSSGSVVTLSSYNATVTATAAGTYTIHFPIAMTTTNYAAQLSGRGTASQPARIFVENHDGPQRTTTDLNVYCINSSGGGLVNPERYCVTIFE